MGKHRQESAGSIAVDPDNLNNRKEGGRVAQGTQDLGKKCTSKKSASPLPCLIRGFRTKHHCDEVRCTLAQNWIRK